MTDERTGPPPGEDPPAPGTAAPTDEPGAVPPTRPVFRRSATDSVLGGVAGGLARTFEIDPVVVRILTVVLALVFPPVFVGYLAAWLMVARDGEPARPPTGGVALRQSSGVLFWVGVVVLAGALIAAFDDPFSGRPGLLALVLIGIGIALWTRDPGRSRGRSAAWPSGAPTSASPPPPSTAPTTTGASMSATPTRTQPEAPGGASGGPPPRGPAQDPGPQRPGPAGPPPPPRPRSPLGAVTIALALITTGVVAALDQVPGIPLDADPSHLAAVALLVLGLGQLVGAFWGRARWITLVAIFLIPPVVFGAVVREVDASWDLEIGDVAFTDGIGERSYRLDGDEPLPADVGLAIGSIQIDLEDWEPDPEQRDALDGDDDLVVDVGAGEVRLVTPAGVPWRLVGEVRIGEIVVESEGGDDRRLETVDASEPLEVIRSGGPQDGEVLDIVVDVRIGQLTVTTPEYDPTPQELS